MTQGNSQSIEIIFLILINITFITNDAFYDLNIMITQTVLYFSLINKVYIIT